MKLLRKILAQRKYIKRLLVHNKDVAIISNNCIGASICGDFALQYNSPTLNLQISPLEFTKFCKSIEYYCTLPIVKVDKLTEYQTNLMKDIYGESFTLNFPIGMVGDITVFFQHYTDFEKAKSDWNRRKKRVKIENCVFVFIEIFTDKYLDALMEFDTWEMDKNRKLVIFRNKTEAIIENCLYTKICVPENAHFMEYRNVLSKYYQNGFAYLQFINSVKT